MVILTSSIYIYILRSLESGFFFVDEFLKMIPSIFFGKRCGIRFPFLLRKLTSRWLTHWLIPRIRTKAVRIEKSVQCRTQCRITLALLRYVFVPENDAPLFQPRKGRTSLLMWGKKAFFSGYHTARVDGEFHVLFRFSKTLITLN